MDEYGSVRSTYKGFESEAAMKETLDKYGSKPRAIISVEGYDTCLPEEDIKKETYQAKATGTPRKRGGRRTMMMGTPVDSSGWVDRSHSDHGSGP